MTSTFASQGADARVGDRLLQAGVVLGLGFQAVHALEHVLQTAYWALHPVEAPWLTPWAASGRDALAAVTANSPAEGNELLHLAGNLLFLAGLAVLLGLVRRRRSATPRGLRAALWLQGAHVAEHLLLTASSLWVGRALGVTTAFGQLAGPVGSSVRVWAHFLLNIAATWLATVAVVALIREDRGSRGVTASSA
ncbi:MAG TPA: DUF6008 family protein [Nitriliruptorales bacterium]